MMDYMVLAEILSSKPHKVRKQWYKDRKKIERIKNSIAVVRVLIKLRSIQKTKGQGLLDFG